MNPRTQAVLDAADEHPEVRVVFLIKQLANLADRLETELAEAKKHYKDIASLATDIADHSAPSAIVPKITVERLEHWAKEIHARPLEEFERHRVADALLDAALSLKEAHGRV